jgi:hypothetical protein
MTHYPHKTRLRPAAKPAAPHAPARPDLGRDIMWGRPIFKAPMLPNPRVAFDPLPFTASRVTGTRGDGSDA